MLTAPKLDKQNYQTRLRNTNNRGNLRILSIYLSKDLFKYFKYRYLNI